MASRGRPPHPDILTPREWEVLDLLRERLSNAEIAERLGITERTAKFHVSEILAKLGVAGREEAATWSLSEQELRRRSRFHWSIKWELLAKIGGGAAVAAAAGGVAVLTWGLIATGSPPSDEQSTSPDDATLAAMAGLALPTCAPLDGAAQELPTDCIPGYAVSFNLKAEEVYYFHGTFGSCGSDPPREPIPPWECYKLFSPWRWDTLGSPPGAHLPQPPAEVRGQQCGEQDLAGMSFGESRAGDTCYDWTFDYDGKTWHCWAVYLREDAQVDRSSDAGCVGGVSFADDWPDGLPTPPGGVDRVNWWCDNRARSPDFVQAACSIVDSEADATAAESR